MGRPVEGLQWQSQLILWIVALGVVFVDARGIWQGTVTAQMPVVYGAIAMSALLGLVVWRLKAATAGGALLGAGITMALMHTAPLPYAPLHTGLAPLLVLFVLTYLATKLGRGKKERMGTSEGKRGRVAAQIAANLGVAALAVGSGHQEFFSLILLGALCESAADTMASELGQVLGGTPRMMTTLRRVAPGTDGAITLIGSLAGAVAALLVALVGVWALRLPPDMALFPIMGGVFGLFFDSLLGATLERGGCLNNDAVNFLSTMSAAACSWLLLLSIHSPLLPR